MIAWLFYGPGWAIFAAILGAIGASLLRSGWEDKAKLRSLCIWPLPFLLLVWGHNSGIDSARHKLYEVHSFRSHLDSLAKGKELHDVWARADQQSQGSLKALALRLPADEWDRMAFLQTVDDFAISSQHIPHVWMSLLGVSLIALFRRIRLSAEEASVLRRAATEAERRAVREREKNE